MHIGHSKSKVDVFSGVMQMSKGYILLLSKMKCFESFSVGSVSRRFQQEIVSRNLLQRADINFAKPQEKSYFRNHKFGFVPFVSTLRNLERVRVATGHFTIYSFLEGKVKILAKVGRQRFVAYGWRPLGGCKAPSKK